MGQQPLPPGFRFSPTDVELVSYYLRSKALGRCYHRAVIADVDVYKFEPWDLPAKSALPSKDQEWYFFSAQDKKYSHTARINRTTKKGYWKATGKDRKVFSGSSVIGLKKTLIYYNARAPKGSRTNWIMHEYKLDEEFEKRENIACVAVLCRIRKKGGLGPRNGEQYGAPIMDDESVELDEDVNTGKVDNAVDTGHWNDVESKSGGNAFNLRDQAEAWKQMTSSNVTMGHIDNKENKETGVPIGVSDCNDLESVSNRKGTIECNPDLNPFFQSISDASYFEMAPFLNEHDGDTFLCYHQYLDTHNSGRLFDLDTLPHLPTLLDAEGHLFEDYKGPAFDESEILREMSELINDGKDIGSSGSMMPSAACDAPRDGDYIELDDIKGSLDGFAVRLPTDSRELGRSEEQQLWFRANTNGETCKSLQHSLCPQGSAAHGAQLPIQASKGALKAEKCFYEDETSLNRLRGKYNNAGKHHSGSYFGAVDQPHVVESSTKSYLSKHVSTYAISKHELLPAQLCYASLMDGEDCLVTVSDSTASSTASTVEGKSNVDADGLRQLPSDPIDLSSLSTVLTNSSKDIDADALMKTSAATIFFSVSSGSQVKSNSFGGWSPNIQVPSASQACDQKAKHANISYSNMYRWTAPFKGLVSKAKRSALGTRLIELENGMRAKFNDKMSTLGKPAARLLPARGNASPYDSLRQVLMATLCHLVAALSIFFCLFWGFRVLVTYAFSVAA